MASTLAIFIVVMALSRHWLPLVAVPLICSESITTVDAIAISSGDRRFDFAANTVKGGFAREILLFEIPKGWVVKVGVLPPDEAIARQQLEKRNIDDEKIVCLEGPIGSIWDQADRIRSWLLERPGTSTAFIVSRFRSRENRLVLDQALSAELARRVFVVGLVDRQFDENNWWKSRTGWREVFSAYLHLSYALIVGKPVDRQSEWNPDEYEKNLKGTVEKTGS